MHRRGNKSKKVPNVKLRPAHPDAMARARVSPEAASCWAEDSQIIGSDDTVMLGGSCPRPFRNVVVCATGVLDKPALFKLALELGATSVNAFTDRVTHLVAENHGGAKYLCALERKIPIMLPSWIIDSHRIWQHGDDVDLDQSIAAHRLPVFSDVTLCISGIGEIVRRTKINKAVTAAGGTYVKALERPVRVTHLLCAGDEETDKMRYAEKFNRAGEANPPIQLVWEEWFWDSLEFGGRFDEARYHVRLPRPERRSAPTQARLPDFHQDIDASRRLHPSADDDDADDDADEFASVKRLPAVTLQLWGSLLKGRGYEVSGGGVVLSPGKAREMAILGRAQQQEVDGAEGEVGRGSVLSSFRRANSFVAPRATAVAARTTATREPSAGPSRLPFGRSTTNNNVAGPSTSRAKRLEEVESTNDAPSTVFTGLRFLLRGETDTATVRAAIEAAGGAVARHGDTGIDYIVVRLVSGSVLYRAESDPAARPQYRTECWLERCLFMDRVCEPKAHVSFVPLGVQLPIPNADKITLSFSGLDTSEACWVRRLLKALGITLAPAFSRHTTHLLCPSGTGAKYTRALQWGVPVVDMGWLAAMASDGVVPDVTSFLVSGGEDTAITTDARKGKGKEKAEETMQDITNSYDSQESRSPPPPKDKEEYFLPPPPLPQRLSFGDPGGALVFGRPGGSLGSRSADSHPHSSFHGAPPVTPSPPKRRQSPNTPSRSRSRPATPLALVSHAIPVPTQSSSRSSSVRPSSGPGAVRRAATVGAVSRVRNDEKTRRGPSSSSPAIVPSSTSPSPLRRGASVSPGKIPDERTKALHESIVSLLGKRPAASEDDAPPARAGKRGRPHRSKPQSRQPSDVLPVLAPVDGELSVFGGARRLSPGPDDGSTCEGLSMGADEQSLRVMYEDPGQRAELQRLADLIGEPLESEGNARKRPRRSTRRS